MLYRVLIGLIPTVLIALVMTGAIPIGGLLPATEYRSSAVRAEDGKNGGDKPYAARTPEGRVSQAVGLISSDHVEMMEDNMKAVEDIHRDIEKFEDKERRGVSRDWEPKSGGWGR